MIGIPRIYSKIHKKAVAGVSRKAAITCFCLECCNWNRSEVKRCSNTACFLFPYRPYKFSNPHITGGDGLVESTNASALAVG